MEKKSFLLSKTLWVNVIALIVMLVQTQTGFVIDPEAQGVILGFINLVLRIVTKAPVAWGKGGESQSGSAKLGILVLLLAVVGFMTVQGCGLQGLQDPRSMSAKDLRLVATKAYNNLYDYHVAKSKLPDLTAEEKKALNDIKAALTAVKPPLDRFQKHVDTNLQPSPELRNEILLFLDRWAYKQISERR